MLKKGISMLLFTSAISVGGTSYAAAGTQNQGTDAVVVQLQELKGKANLKQDQLSGVNSGQLQVAGGGALGQAHITLINGTQLQTGTTSGPATVAQWQGIGLGAGQSQAGSSGQQDQATNIGAGLLQVTTVTAPAYVTQVGVINTAALQFQAAIPNGPTMQHQLSNVSVFDFQSAMAIR